MSDATQQCSTESESRTGEVLIKDSDASLKDMVAFALKTTVATVPAVAILLFLYLVVMTVAGRL